MTTLLTSQEMQALINVDRSTVYRMAEDGRLPAVKVGRQWRFPADRVAATLGLAEDSVPAAAAVPRVATHDLARLLSPAVVQSVADLVGDVFGVMAVITDMAGSPLTDVANPCGFFAAIADRPAAAELCLAEWKLFAEEPNVAPRFVRTHLGFLCARTFVWVDLEPVGMLVVGGITPPAWPPQREQIEALATEIGLPASSLLETVHRTWDIDDEHRRRILQLLPRFGDLVSQLTAAQSRPADGGIAFAPPPDDRTTETIDRETA